MSDKTDDDSITLSGFGKVLKMPGSSIKAMDEGEPPLLTLVYGLGEKREPCICRAWKFDCHNRIVACARCGREVDPFEALASLSRAVDWTDHVREVRKQKRLVEMLTKEKKRLRAAVQKLRKQAGEKPWNEWDMEREQKAGRDA